MFLPQDLSKQNFFNLAKLNISDGNKNLVKVVFSHTVVAEVQGGKGADWLAKLF